MIANLKQVKAIFLDAIERQSPEELGLYLDEACQGDEEFRQQVEALLEAHALGESLLDKGAIATSPTLDQPVTEQPGDTIGPYKLIEKIGEGGFGVVFLAEQGKPVRRDVALKVVKAGMDTKEVIARFESERQALAMMDHPNIAKVLDAGATESGRPYFVMELVPGIPINEYCDQCRLTIRERLGLFVSLCRAVQHAHQKGVIHRDLKPSNVLIAMQDGQPTPKIIDFGVVKAINQPLTDQTLKTRYAQILGTPLYMSPEQAELSPLGVDTRTDIYSLGVLLYELLTGTTPFDRERLHSASFDELRHIIREEEPPLPSTRVSTLAGEMAKTVADRHRTDARQLQQTVHGDLDWIVMRAMEKDRTRRYESASSLGRDVERYLADEPVEACPPSTGYRVRKFVRRNKAALATLALVATALLIGIGVASWQAVRATKERDRAVTAEKLAAAEAARSEQVAQLLKDMLAAAGPSVARGRDATLLREVLDTTAERVKRDLSGQPKIQGDMWYTLGTTYQDIGDRRMAVDMLEKAVASYRQEPGHPSTKLALSLGRLGYNQSFLTRVADGKANAQLGVEMARRIGDQSTLAECLMHRAAACRSWGISSDEEVPYLEESLNLYRESGADPVVTARCMIRLAGSSRDFKQAIFLTQEAHEVFLERLGKNHPRTLGAQWTLGQLYLNHGDFTEAEPLLRKSLKQWEKVYDKDHPLNQVVRRKLAVCLTLLDERDEADDLLANVAPRLITAEHTYLVYYEDIIVLLAELGRHREARDFLDELQKKSTEVESTLGADHERTKKYRRTIAELSATLGTDIKGKPLPAGAGASAADNAQRDLIRTEKLGLIDFDEVAASERTSDDQADLNNEQKNSGR